MKNSIQAMRALVPGMDPDTDKAKVLEYTVEYLLHLKTCPSDKFHEFVPETTPLKTTVGKRGRPKTSDSFLEDEIQVAEVVEMGEEDKENVSE